MSLASAETRIVLWTVLEENLSLNVSFDVTRRNRSTAHTKTLKVLRFRSKLHIKLIDPTNGTEFRFFHFGVHSGTQWVAEFPEHQKTRFVRREIVTLTNHFFVALPSFLFVKKPPECWIACNWSDQWNRFFSDPIFCGNSTVFEASVERRNDKNFIDFDLIGQYTRVCATNR